MLKGDEFESFFGGVRHWGTGMLTLMINRENLLALTTKQAALSNMLISNFGVPLLPDEI